MVYVLSKTNEPLMPCENVIARLLLKQGKAKIKYRQPFTIKLLNESTKYVQNLTIGIDTGSGTLGSAVSTDNNKILYMSKVKLRNDIVNKLRQRSNYRSNRRSRKTRYRKARWLNRKNSIKKNRFSPTMISKFYSHIKEIEFIKSILPTSVLVLETSTFNYCLNHVYENTRAKILNRDNYTCQICKGKHKDKKLEVHHIVFRSEGGSDEPDNLITLCHTCHSLLHADKIKVELIGKKRGQLKYATQMNSIRSQLLKKYPEAIETFGYITKANRIKLQNIDKDHHLDACVIATGGGQPIFKTKDIYLKRHVPKGDYQRTRGVRSQQRMPSGKIYGFKKFDKVRYFGKEYFIKGRKSSGYADLMDINGNKINFSSNPVGSKTPKLKDLKRVSARKSILVDVIRKE